MQNKEVFVCITKSLYVVREVKLSNLSQCITCEVFVSNSKGYIGVVYRFSSQDNAEFENFLSDFEECLSKTASSSSLIALILILGDFGADHHPGTKKTKQQLKVHMWPLRPYITFIN